MRRCPADKVIILCEGAPVILIKNISPVFVNGLRGTIVECGPDPVVDFGGRILTLNKYTFHENDSSRFQYPIKVAYAVTVHRAQGQTLENVIVDCADFFMPRQIGVAVGRATKMSTLQVINYDASLASFTADMEIEAFMEYQLQRDTKLTDTCCVSEIQKYTPVEIASPEIELGTVPGPSSIVSHDDIEFLQQIKISLPSDALKTQVDNIMANTNLGVFLQKINEFVTSRISEITEAASKSEKLKSQATLSAFTKVHEYLTSQTFADLCSGMFDVQPSKTERKVCTKIVFGKLEEKLKSFEHDAQVNLPSHNDTEDNPLPDVLPTSVRSKIRYIAGCTIAKISYRHREYVKRKMYKHRDTSLKEDKIKRLLFAQVTIPESAVLKESTDPESLGETQSRQGNTSGLTHVPDSVYEFFLSLYRLLYNNATLRFQFEQGLRSVASVGQLISSSCDLLQRWFLIFDKRCSSTSDDEDEDILTSMQFAIYEEAVSYFTRLWCSELLKLKRVQLTTKKQSLRSGLKGQATKKQKVTETASLPETGEEGMGHNTKVYKCEKCDKVCVENPKNFDEDSIGCDGAACESWFHYKCVGLTGQEPFLARSSSKWFCDECKRKTPINVKGKGKRTTKKK